jgi:hypothetical protein
VSRESVCQVACSWVDVGSFHTCVLVRFMIFSASVRNILDTSSYVADCISQTFYSVLVIAGYPFSRIVYLLGREGSGVLAALMSWALQVGSIHL